MQKPKRIIFEKALEILNIPELTSKITTLYFGNDFTLHLLIRAASRDQGEAMALAEQLLKADPGLTVGHWEGTSCYDQPFILVRPVQEETPCAPV